MLWVIGIVAVVAVLVRTHRITESEIIVFCVIVPSIILHEIAHGWVALACGDDTAKRAGRLTLNPLAHIDPVGTLLVPGLLALSGVGFFGWAKPVPVDLRRLRSPRNQGVLVSLAGPATNVLLAALGAVLFITLDAAASGGWWALTLFYLGLTNLLLAVVNMIPIPPLDGSVLLERALPAAWWPGYLRVRNYGMPLLLVIVLINYELHPGPITWLYDQLQTWWLHLLLSH
jgi:Zn-dependent protease